MHGRAGRENAPQVPGSRSVGRATATQGASPLVWKTTFTMPGIDFGDRILVQVPEGLRFWPPDSVAMIREEHGNRLEVTSASGEVGHRPGPLAAFASAPFAAAKPGVLLNRRHARRRGEEWRLPGGWKLPRRGPLVTLPSKYRAEEKPIPGVGPTASRVTDLLPSEVLCVQRHSSADVRWHNRPRVDSGGGPQPEAPWPAPILDSSAS